jgi:hypothetical protein
VGLGVTARMPRWAKAAAAAAIGLHQAVSLVVLYSSMHHQIEHTSQPCFHLSRCKLLAGADVGGVRLDDGAAFRMRYRDR